MLRINEIIEAVKAYHPNADVQAIMKAYVYSAKVHEGQSRLSGEPYLSHPLAVAGLLAEMQVDVPSICSGLLHDAVEDTPATMTDIRHLLGEEVASLVDGVTKITSLETTGTARQAESLRKMILATAQDIRVLLIKLADRLHNMRTLGYQSLDKQKVIATETRDIYAPMAHRLGIRRWQVELEDLALYYLEPEVYQRIKDRVALSTSEREPFIKEVKKELADLMAAQNITCRVEGRHKHFYSIYQKTIRRNVDMEELFDIVAFRIIVESVKDCYEALGILHSRYKPVPGRFRDYIGMPKPNMYQSLHTTVLGSAGQRMEIQIRTEQMHKVAEDGIAAHWQYKEASEGDTAEQHRFAWLRRLLESQRENPDPGDYLRSVRMDLYPEEIFVFTPDGEVKELPRGATPIDFAYAIHTEVGHQCVGAKVNGRMVPLRTELNTGDQVEIITKVDHRPSRDWLRFAASARARTKIRAYIRQSERQRAVALGRELVDRELRKHNLTLDGVLRAKKLDPLLEQFSLAHPEHLLAAVAYGKVSSRQVVNRVLPKPAEEPREGLISRSLRRLRRRPSEGIKVKGVDDILVRMGQCCNPLPGDDVVGYITRGRGVTVHRADCPQVERVDRARRVEVSWEADVEHPLPVLIEVVSHDRSGMLADITATLKERQMNIIEGRVHTTPDAKGVARLLIQVSDAGQLQKLFSDLKRIKGVYTVRRVRRA